MSWVDVGGCFIIRDPSDDNSHSSLLSKQSSCGAQSRPTDDAVLSYFYEEITSVTNLKTHHFVFTEHRCFITFLGGTVRLKSSHTPFTSLKSRYRGFGIVVRKLVLKTHWRLLTKTHWICWERIKYLWYVYSKSRLSNYIVFAVSEIFCQTCGIISPMLMHS